MLNTNAVRLRLDRLCAADGADTYWRDRMIEALDEVDTLQSALDAADKRNNDLKRFNTELHDRLRRYEPESDGQEVSRQFVCQKCGIEIDDDEVYLDRNGKHADCGGEIIERVVVID